MARQALGSRLMEEARTAISRQDYTAARRWMGEARDAGVDAAGTASLERDIVAAQSSVFPTAE